ncbi:MAG: hypothetical protein R3B93_21900 [Bacteroidia bacterium]
MIRFYYSQSFVAINPVSAEEAEHGTVNPIVYFIDDKGNIWTGKLENNEWQKFTKSLNKYPVNSLEAVSGKSHHVFALGTDGTLFHTYADDPIPQNWTGSWASNNFNGGSFTKYLDFTAAISTGSPSKLIMHAIVVDPDQRIGNQILYSTITRI